jgi:hypothetical protein
MPLSRARRFSVKERLRLVSSVVDVIRVSFRLGPVDDHRRCDLASF